MGFLSKGIERIAEQEELEKDLNSRQEDILVEQPKAVSPLSEFLENEINHNNTSLKTYLDVLRKYVEEPNISDKVKDDLTREYMKHASAHERELSQMLYKFKVKNGL